MLVIPRRLLYLLFFLSVLRVYHVSPFGCDCSSFPPLPLLRVHSCWGSVCAFASFVDFPFFLKRVSCEGSFSPHGFHLYTGCQRVTRMYFWVLWPVWIFLVELARTRFHPKRSFLPSTKDHWPSESRAMRDRKKLTQSSLIRSCVRVEVAVLGCPF